MADPNDLIRKPSSSDTLEQGLLYDENNHQPKKDEKVPEPAKPDADLNPQERAEREEETRAGRLQHFSQRVGQQPATEPTQNSSNTADSSTPAPIKLTGSLKVKYDQIQYDLELLKKNQIDDDLVAELQKAQQNDPNAPPAPAPTSKPITEIKKELDDAKKKGKHEVKAKKSEIEKNREKIALLKEQYIAAKNELQEATEAYKKYEGVLEAPNVLSVLKAAGPDAELIVGSERKKYKAYDEAFTQEVIVALKQATTTNTPLKDIINDSQPRVANTITTDEFKKLEALSYFSMSALELLDTYTLFQEYKNPDEFIQLSKADSDKLNGLASFSSPNAGEIRDKWQEIKDRKAKAESEEARIGKELQAALQDQVKLDGELQKARENVPHAEHQAWNQQMKELAKANPALATYMAAAFKISNDINRLDKEQIKAQLEAAAAYTEWQNHVETSKSSTSSTELEPHLAKVAEAMVKAHKHLVKLKNESAQLKSELGQLSQGVEKEVADTKQKVKDIKEGASWFGYTDDEKEDINNEDAATNLLNKVHEDAKAAEERVGKEIEQSARNIDKAREEINTTYAEKQQGGFFGQASLELQKGNYPSALAKGAATILTSPVTGVYDYLTEESTASRAKKAWQEGSYGTALFNGLLSATILPLAIHHVAGNSTISASEELASDKNKPLRLVKLGRTDITLTASEKGTSIDAVLPWFLTTSAKQHIVLRFIGECIRKGLIQEDAKGHRTLNMTHIASDEMRAMLVAALGQLGIKPVGPAMEEKVKDEAAYANHVKEAEAWMEEKKNNYLLRNPEVNKHPDKKSPAVMKPWQFHLHAEMMGGAARAAEHFHKRKKAKAAAGVKFGDSQGNGVGAGVHFPDPNKNSGVKTGVTHPSTGTHSTAKSSSGVKTGVTIPATATSGTSCGVTHSWKSSVAAPPANANCLFEAVANQLNSVTHNGRNNYDHAQLRTDAVDHVVAHPVNFPQFNAKSATEKTVYATTMKTVGTLPTAQEITALAAQNNVCIQVTNVRNNKVKSYGDSSHPAVSLVHNGAGQFETPTNRHLLKI